MKNKNEVYVVVDTPKKAKKLKNVLDMFGEKLNRVDVDAIKMSHYNGSAKLYTEYNKSYFNGINWTLMDICEDKTKVSIKELRTILAKEHLKEGDYVVINVFGIGKIESINGSSFEIDDETFHFDNFKRYATPEEIELFEPREEVIKNDDKPKIGDVVKIVLFGEDGELITKIENLEIDSDGDYIVNGWCVTSLEVLDQQEVIDLLFPSPF